MNVKTGEIEYIPNETQSEYHKRLTELETTLLEDDEADGKACVAAWNAYITSRPKTSTIEKIKMRQAFIVGWKAKAGQDESDKEV